MGRNNKIVEDSSARGVIEVKDSSAGVIEVKDSSAPERTYKGAEYSGICRSCRRGIFVYQKIVTTPYKKGAQPLRKERAIRVA